jgi:L-ribulose-5-phosphate 3-epimerase
MGTGDRAGMNRREAIARLGVVVGAAALAPRVSAGRTGGGGDPPFRISLAQWSLHRALQAKELDPLDFPRTAAKDYAIDAVEYVNTFYKERIREAGYVAELRKRCDDLGVTSVLIMCDGEGKLGDPDEARRKEAVENHYKWVEAAKVLGCHSIRVNAGSAGSRDEQRDLAADGLRRLTEFAAQRDLNVIVENHGGLSSDGSWLASTIRAVGHPRCGTLPDFGNFCLDWSKSSDPAMWYDRYKGVAEMMPFAKGVSAKSYGFDEAGNETTIDYPRMMKIVLDAGYHGRVGIEYEGDKHSEPEGIRLTKRLLERIRDASGG